MKVNIEYRYCIIRYIVDCRYILYFVVCCGGDMTGLGPDRQMDTGTGQGDNCTEYRPDVYMNTTQIGDSKYPLKC